MPVEIIVLDRYTENPGVLPRDALAAAFDVVAADAPLLKAKNCIIAPRISWALKESCQGIMNTTIIKSVFIRRKYKCS